MKGVDTNVLVRFLVRDDESQAKKAEKWLSKNCSPEDPGWLSVIVLCELSWVLARGYGYDREEIAKVLLQLTQTVDLEVEDHDIVRRAARKYAEGPADFADYLLGMRNVERGTATTITFDRRAAKLSEFELLK